MTVLTAALKTGSPSVKADLYHAASDFFSTSLVFVALGLTSIGYAGGDTVISFVIAGLLGYLSIRLIYSSMLDLSDAVSGKLVQSVLREIKTTNEVLKVKSLRVRRVGEQTYVDAVCAISPDAKVTDADTIASRIETNLTKLLGKATVMIHVEPLEWGVPIELQVRNATNQVEGAKGVHNLSVTAIEDWVYVTLHVQVDPSLPLDKAHEIARSVEQGIEKSIPRVRQVTVHLEPLLPEIGEGQIVEDKHVSDTVRSVIKSYPDVLEISAIATYRAEGNLHINVHCLFRGDEPISEVHEMISKIEESVRKKFDNAIVTIHPEPVTR